MSKLFGSLVPEMNIKRKLVTRIPEEEANIPYYDIPVYCKEIIEPKYETINKIGRVELTKGLELDVYGDFEQPWFMGTDISRILNIENNSKAMTGIPDSTKCKFLSLSSREGQTRGGFNESQAVWFINEAGLYSKLATSRKPEAEKYMMSIYDTLSSIRKQTGNIVFTENTFVQYELINKLLMKDSRIGYGKTIKILKSLGMSNLDEMSFRDILKDLNFLQLDERKFIISYDKSLIRCHNTSSEDGYKIYVPVSFSYIGIQTLLQYFNKNNMISFTDGNIVNFKEVSNEYDEDLEDE